MGRFRWARRIPGNPTVAAGSAGLRGRGVSGRLAPDPRPGVRLLCGLPARYADGGACPLAVMVTALLLGIWASVKSEVA